MPESYCTKCKGKTEAICIDCLQKNIVEWRPLESLFFYDKTKKFKEKTKFNLKCKCGKPADTCPRCYHEYIHNCLKQEYPDLAEEFAVFFM